MKTTATAVTTAVTRRWRKIPVFFTKAATLATVNEVPLPPPAPPPPPH